MSPRASELSTTDQRSNNYRKSALDNVTCTDTTPVLSPEAAIEKARSSEDTSIENMRVRQLTALVARLGSHPEVTHQLDGYRMPSTKNTSNYRPQSPIKRDLSAYRLLEREETEELGYRIDDGLEAYNRIDTHDATARIVGAVTAHQTIAVCNLRFVYHIAGYYSKVAPASRAEIYEWGMPGLLNAVKSYNASLGFPVITDARH